MNILMNILMNIDDRNSNFVKHCKVNSGTLHWNWLPVRRKLKRIGFPIFFPILLITTLSLLVLDSSSVAQQMLPVRVDRWIEIQQISGTVTEVIDGISRPARISGRLQNVGDAVITGNASSAVLAVDTAIGTIAVAENTSVQIDALSVLPTGGHITHLSVTGGQVRLELRPFTNPDSELEIKTPAGISGVRGTTFGVSVQPSGQTGVATIDGIVSATAQGEQVEVSAGLQTLIIPGEPPTPPEPLRDDPRLDLRALRRVGRRMVQMIGQTDPVNLLVINDVPQTLTRTGEFDLQVPIPGDRRIAAAVTTPLGTRQSYTIVVP
jgi:hypothetical protein